MVWIGLLMVACGLLLVRWAGARQFTRRNTAGMEEFKSYDAALTTRAGERLAVVVGRGLTFLGLVVLLCFWIVGRIA